MKKLIFITAFILFAGVAFGQTIKKATLIGTHVMTVTLQPNVTMDQFIDYFQSKYAPELEKNLSGWKMYLLKGIHGENTNSLGILYVVDSEADRDKYINDDGSFTDLGKAAYAKMQPVWEEMTKIGSFKSTFTDWIVQ